MRPHGCAGGDADQLPVVGDADVLVPAAAAEGLQDAQVAGGGVQQ